MKTKNNQTNTGNNRINTAIHYLGLGAVYALGLFIVILQLRSLL